MAHPLPGVNYFVNGMIAYFIRRACRQTSLRPPPEALFLAPDGNVLLNDPVHE
jgi:hypothetical protein